MLVLTHICVAMGGNSDFKKFQRARRGAYAQATARARLEIPYILSR
jgi:hypothetical protein